MWTIKQNMQYLANIYKLEPLKIDKSGSCVLQFYQIILHQSQILE